MSGRGLTTEQVELLQLEDVEVQILVEIDSSPDFTWRFCTGSFDAEYDGDLYTRRPISMSVSNSGKVDGTHCTISICNRDDLSGTVKLTGINGAVVTIILLTIVNSIAQEPIVIEVGSVNRCKISEDMTIDVVPLNRGLKASGLLRCSRMCPYVFGGPLCGYATPDGNACDRSLPACTAFGNQLRFGGFIWALDAGETILVQQPVQVNPPSASNSGDDGYECHSGRFVTLRRPDGSTYQVETGCNYQPLSNEAGDVLDGLYTDPWDFHVYGEGQLES